MSGLLLRSSIFGLLFLSLQLVGMNIVLAESSNNQMESPENPVIQQIPYKQENVLSTVSVGRFAFAGIFSLIVAIGVIYFMKRYYFGKDLIGVDRHKIRLLESRKITPKTFIFLIRYSGKDYLLAQVGDTLQVIDKTEADISNKNDEGFIFFFCFIGNFEHYTSS